MIVWRHSDEGIWHCEEVMSYTLGTSKPLCVLSAKKWKAQSILWWLYNDYVSYYLLQLSNILFRLIKQRLSSLLIKYDLTIDDLKWLRDRSLGIISSMWDTMILGEWVRRSVTVVRVDNWRLVSSIWSDCISSGSSCWIQHFIHFFRHRLLGLIRFNNWSTLFKKLKSKNAYIW